MFGMRRHALVHRLGEDLAVHGQRRAAGHARRVGAREQQAPQRAQLRLEQAVRVGEIDRLEGVAADELGQPVGVMGRRPHRRPHLVQRHAHAALRERPGRLRAGETAADNGGDDGDVHASATSSGSASTILLPHFMQVRVSPSALLIFFSMPTQPHSGQVSGTGLFQVEKSHAG